MTWSIMVGFAPCASSFVGISRSSGVHLLLPQAALSLANPSLSSFLSVSLWPFTHVKVVLVDLLFSRCVTFFSGWPCSLSHLGFGAKRHVTCSIT